MPAILKIILIGGGALLYGASPIDLIPEILAGPLGDAVILVAAGVAIYRILKNRRARAATNTPPPQAASTSPPRAE